MRLYLVAFFIFVIEQVNIIMNKNIFCIIACISFIHFACKKDQSKITNKTVAGEWVDTSFSRYAYTLMTHGNDSMDNTLLYDFGIIFQEFHYHGELMKLSMIVLLYITQTQMAK